MSNLFTEVSVEQQEIVSGGRSERLSGFRRFGSSSSSSLRESFSFFSTTTTEESGSFEEDFAQAESSLEIDEYVLEEEEDGGLLGQILA